MKICVVNQFKSDNIGDKLIGKTLYEFFLHNNIEVVLAGFSQTEDMSVCKELYNSKRDLVNFIKLYCPAFFKYVFRFRKRIIREAQRIEIFSCDAIVIGGGQLIKHNGVFPYAFRLWSKLAKKYKIPIYIYGIGVDSNLTWRDFIRYKQGLKYAQYISCRDEESVHNLKKMCKTNIDVFPDVVFSRGLIEKKGDFRKKEYILVMPYCYMSAKKNFHSVKNRDDYYDYIYNLIKKNTKYKCVLSATTSEDLYECSLFSLYLKKKGICGYIIPAFSDDELVDIISKADYIISGRMHAMILAKLLEVTSYPLEISPKITDFAESILVMEDIGDVIAESQRGLLELKNRLLGDMKKGSL